MQLVPLSPASTADGKWLVPPSPASTSEVEWPAPLSPPRAVWWENQFLSETGNTEYTRIRTLTLDGKVVSRVRNEGCWSRPQRCALKDIILQNRPCQIYAPGFRGRAKVNSPKIWQIAE